MSVKINSLEVENVKRIKAVKLEPTQNGLTVIGGRNGQGKTSVLDAIAWALGGEKYRPSQAQREGSVIPPNLHIELSNGLIVERRGKNGSLKVTDPNGVKGGQALLNEFVEQFALDLPKFMTASNAEKAKILLRIIGLESQLSALDFEEKKLYNERHSIGVIADQKKKYAAEMECFEGVPDEPVSASELIKQQQEILARNGENQRRRFKLQQLQQKAAQQCEKIKQLKAQHDQLVTEYNETLLELEDAEKSAEQLTDESTTELEESINNIEEINRKVRANLDKEKAEDDARHYIEQYDTLTDKIESIRIKRTKLLGDADLPLPELSVNDGELMYKGQKWDCMSASEQLRVSTAIIHRLNPNCGFVLLDKLEQMDTETLREFGEWLESEGLQAIATRVSSGGECSIIIEDGYSDNINITNSEPQKKTWKAGEF